MNKTEHLLFNLIPFQQPEQNITIQGQLDFQKPGNLLVAFEVQGAIDTIQWPNRQINNSRADELWKHTCFEMFIKPANQSNYWEFNASNDQLYNCYRFTHYREGMQPETLVANPEIQFIKAPNKKVLFSANWALQSLISQNALANVQIGISCVIQYTTEAIDYFALRHCSDRPDFHQTDGFQLTMQF